MKLRLDHDTFTTVLVSFSRHLTAIDSFLLEALRSHHHFGVVRTEVDGLKKRITALETKNTEVGQDNQNLQTVGQSRILLHWHTIYSVLKRIQSRAKRSPQIHPSFPPHRAIK